MVSFLQISYQNFLWTSIPHILHALPISSSLVWYFLPYLVRSVNYIALHYAITPSLLLLNPLRPKYSPQDPVLSSSIGTRGQVSRPHKIACKIIILHVKKNVTRRNSFRVLNEYVRVRATQNGTHWCFETQKLAEGRPNITWEIVYIRTQPFSFCSLLFLRLTSSDIACWGTSIRNCYRT